MTKLYFKWDGRNGSTAFVGITGIQTLLIVDIGMFVIRHLYERNETRHYVETGKWATLLLFIILLIYNIKKYTGKYNKLRFHWKNENKTLRIKKGIVVILSLIVPWIPLILMGMLWD